MMRAPDDTTELALMPVKCFPPSPAVIPGVDVGSQLTWQARLVPNNSRVSLPDVVTAPGGGPAGSAEGWAGLVGSPVGACA
jgi:hypothetical protein